MKNIEGIYPLSATQEGMLFHTLYAPQSKMYFQQISFTVRGLDRSAFRRAWEQVVNRHAALRSFFWLSDTKKAQVVCKGVHIDWDEQDWSELEFAGQQERLANYLQADRRRGIDVSRPPLMRCALMRLSPDTDQFIWSFHHMILDGWSCSVVLKEVFVLTESYCNGIDVQLEPLVPYQDYIAWLQRQDMHQAEEFWRRALKGFRAPTSLGIGHARKSVGATEFGEELCQLSAAATSALQEFSRQHQLTLHTLFQAAWALLLSRYSGETDVVFGTTVAGRPPDLAGIESMVGLFINTVPFRVQVHSDQKVLPWLASLQAHMLEMQPYDYVPLVKVHGWSEVPRKAPLFESILVFENYPLDRKTAAPGLRIGDVRSIERTNYPLTILVVPGEQLSLRVSYRTETIDPQAVRRLLKHFDVVLEAFLTHKDQTLGHLPMLGEEERRQILVEWNDTEVRFPDQDTCIHQLISRQAEAAADAVAVVFEDQQLTYGQLNRRANQLAHYLRKRGVGPDVLVGICMHRSLELVVGLLGILKAGGAYVPLDPDYPPQRLAFMLADAQVGVLLTQERLREALPPHGAELVCVDADWTAIEQEISTDPESTTTPDNLAYVMYTSGSTGTPK
ncbi:MAG TPA: condensation domain-containing protein, partial [Candidatus Acidoferrales bacterium]|nr:condensation domain-containing protein [Candidatus Acidoferrales bacterium]